MSNFWKGFTGGASELNKLTFNYDKLTQAIISYSQIVDGEDYTYTDGFYFV